MSAKEQTEDEKKLLRVIDWNDGYYLEGIDRCYTISVMNNELLKKHEVNF